MAPPGLRRPRPLVARKRLSLHRLSSDTTSSLPAYSSPASTRPASATEWPHAHIHDDQPPDYPDQEDDFADQEDNLVPLPSSRPTPFRRLRHRRSDSRSLPTSPSVDDLLERSVVALELSTNALLQSIDTQSSLSAIKNDQILERSLDRQTKMLDLRVRGSRGVHDDWMEDLDKVMKGVDDLFKEEAGAESGVSRSLPTETSHVRRRPRPRASMDVLKSQSDTPHLHLSTSELDLRETMRPPRALTQYVSVESSFGEACEATADAESIYLPSTTGLRAAAQIRSFAGNREAPRLRQSASAPGPDLHPPLSSSTRAYSMLSHFVSRHSSLSPPRHASLPATQPSPVTSESTARRTVRRHSAGSSDSNITFPAGPSRSRSNSRGQSSTSSEPSPLPPVRAMTPPLEETTPSSSDSSSSPQQLNAFRTMQSLRKILDEAVPSDPKGKSRDQSRSPRPGFQPRTPSVAASSSTSTATATVTRLFTRSAHHHRSAPRQSSLKLKNSDTPPAPGTPVPSVPASRLSSAPSTPRQVSFAELPDSYSGRPRRRGRDKGRGKGKGKKGGGKEEDEANGWWRGWFTATGSGSGMITARHDERLEERFMRGWGRPGAGGGGMEEWMQ